MGKVNFITYSESVTRLLPPPYVSNCKEYDKSEEQNTRSDCIQSCVDQNIMDKFNLNCIWSYGNLNLIRNQNITYKHICNWKYEERRDQIVEQQKRLRKSLRRVLS